nr:hypothetical protein BACY1_00570 [Tenacibaculum mesophilum]
MVSTRTENPYYKELFSFIPGIENAEGITTVEAETLTEKEFLEKWVSKNEACLIKGAVKKWPASKKWKEKKYWKSFSKDFNIFINMQRNYNDRELNNSKKFETSFHKVIDRFFSEEDPNEILSLPAEIIDKRYVFAPLGDEIPGFHFLKNPRKTLGYPPLRFFLYKNASTAWHYHDVDETLMCQVKGDKLVCLLRPDVPNAKKVTPYLNNEEYISGKNLDGIKDLKPILVEVKDGDALYIPINWFHAVIPTESKVGVTLAYCWGNSFHKYGNLTNYFVRRMYRQVLWPVGIYTFLMPFLGVYSVLSYGFNKLLGRV